MRIFIDTWLSGSKKTWFNASWTKTFSNKTWHCIRELSAWKYPRDVPTAGGVQWRAIKYLPNRGRAVSRTTPFPSTPRACLYIYFLIIDTNPTTDYVLWVDERLTVGLMKFHTGTPAFLTYAYFASCRINMLLIVNTGFTVALWNSRFRDRYSAHTVGSQPYRVSIRLISVRIIRNNWRYNEQSGGTSDRANIELIKHYFPMSFSTLESPVKIKGFSPLHMYICITILISIS